LSAPSSFWPVFRVTLDNTYSLTAAYHRYILRRERLWEPILAGFGLASLAVIFGYGLYQVARGFVSAGFVVGQPGIAFTFSLLALMVLLIFFGIPAVISVFYFSNDLDLLVPLPLKPGTILLAKFGAVLVGEYAVVALALVPTAVAWAQTVGGGPAFWLCVVVVMALAPVIPLGLSALVAIGMMRFVNRRHRDLLIVIFSILLTGFFLGLQVLVFGAVPQGQDPQAYLQALLAGRVDLVAEMGRAFPPVVWATRAIVSPDLGVRLGSLLGFVAACLAAVGAVALVGEKLFYGGLIGGAELPRRRLDEAAVEAARRRAEAATRQRGVLRALFLREWRLFVRVPIYALNGFAPALIVPVVFILPVLTLRTDPDIERLLRAVEASGNAQFYMALLVAAVMLFLAGINTTSATAVSREGRTLWVSKVIPASPAQQVRGKLLFASVGAMVSTLPTLVVFSVFFGLTPLRIVEAILLGSAGSAVLLIFGLLYDMWRPFLGWTNPQQAVKSNLNVIVPLPVGFGLILGGLALVRWLTGSVGLGELTVVAVLAGILVALAVVLYRVTLSLADTLYGRLEV